MSACEADNQVDLGRWLSPDPLGGDVTNPQSVSSSAVRCGNRYAYVSNNPTTFVDPKGLHLRQPGEGDDYGCTVDGLATDCADAAQQAGAGAIAGCPNNACSVIGTDAYTGQPSFLQFSASASGASGYLSLYDWTQGVNDVNGTFLSNVGYQAYVRGNFLDAINAQLAATINALEDNGVGQKYITAFADYESQNFSSIYVDGGNANFSSSGYDATTGTGFSFGFGCGMGRCDLSGLGTLDFSHNNDYFHLDTADPWNSLGSALLHLGVDVIGGNVGYTVIPR